MYIGPSNTAATVKSMRNDNLSCFIGSADHLPSHVYNRSGLSSRAHRGVSSIVGLCYRYSRAQSDVISVLNSVTGNLCEVAAFGESKGAFVTCTSHDSIIYCIRLLFYDHLLTFPGEVEFVWKRKFSAVTLLFIMNRYDTLIDKALLVVDSSSCPNQTDQVRMLYFPTWSQDSLSNHFSEVQSVASPDEVAFSRSLQLSRSDHIRADLHCYCKHSS